MGHENIGHTYMGHNFIGRNNVAPALWTVGMCAVGMFTCTSVHRSIRKGTHASADIFRSEHLHTCLSAYK